MTFFSVVETLIFDILATLGQMKQRTTADPSRREIGQPESLNHVSVGFMMPVRDDAHRSPAQRFPAVEVAGVPDLDAVGPVPESGLRRLGARASSGGLQQLGQVGFQARHHRPPQIPDGVEKRCGGELPIDDHIVSKEHPITKFAVEESCERSRTMLHRLREVDPSAWSVLATLFILGAHNVRGHQVNA